MKHVRRKYSTLCRFSLLRNISWKRTIAKIKFDQISPIYFWKHKPTVSPCATLLEPSTVTLSGGSEEQSFSKSGSINISHWWTLIILTTQLSIKSLNLQWVLTIFWVATLWLIYMGKTTQPSPMSNHLSGCSLTVGPHNLLSCNVVVDPWVLSCAPHKHPLSTR